MREPGFLNTFAAVSVIGLAFQAGVHRHRADQDALDAAEERLAYARLENARLKNIMLRRMLAERDAASWQ